MHSAAEPAERIVFALGVTVGYGFALERSGGIGGLSETRIGVGGRQLWMSIRSATEEFLIFSGRRPSNSVLQCELTPPSLTLSGPHSARPRSRHPGAMDSRPRPLAADYYAGCMGSRRTCLLQSQFEFDGGGKSVQEGGGNSCGNRCFDQLRPGHSPLLLQRELASLSMASLHLAIKPDLQDVNHIYMTCVLRLHTRTQSEMCALMHA